MKAITFQALEKVHCETVPDPTLQDDGDVIVRVQRAGLCGSDLHVYHGREKDLDVGTIMGHELAGEIVDVGKNVQTLKKGDRVAAPFTTNCGACFFCDRGLTARCQHSQLFGWLENREGLHGGQAEYVRVPLAESTLLRLPENVSLEEGLLLGDNFTTGFYCAEMAEIEPDGTYLVLGCGTVGLMTIWAARQLGAERLYAFDPVEHRAKLAQDLGAQAYSDAEVLEAELMEATDGRGPDSIMEVVGSLQAQAMAFKLLRPGGILAVAGVHTADHFAFSPTDAFNQNLIYKTGRCSARAKMEALLPLVQQKNIDLASIFISHRMPLEQGEAAYRLFAAREDGCIKLIFEV